ncbi:unnamed protein product [Effrenium voratum]|uniref:Sushi domain-containing protein n=1 Tax=Effrenium voratum TaxID=2562239 RepID=A0AA36MMX0_9DINO|nr:unnamed protein product [Effrenium voratum]
MYVTILAAVVAIVGGLVWLIWSFRAEIKTWWKHAFPTRCSFTDWSDWAACTASCGVGSSSAERSFEPPRCQPEPAPAELRRRRLCEEEECLRPLHCEVGPWTAWSHCSEPCGGGVSSRSRSQLVAPNALGRPCPATFQEWPCEVVQCSRFCHVTAWSPWGPCSRSCGRGRMQRQRTSIPKRGVQGVRCPREVDESSCDLAECLEQSKCVFQVAPRVDHAEPLDGCNGTSAEQSCAVQCAVGYREDRPLICSGGLRFLRSRCLPERCGDAPRLANSRPTARCSGLAHGEECLLDCRAGFQKSDNLRCELGHLNVPHCRSLGCGSPPRPMHSTAIFLCPDGRADCAEAELKEKTLEDCEGLADGEVCQYFACSHGFVKTDELTCKSFNFNRPRCIEKPCLGAPPAVAHAVVDTDDGVAKECRFLAYNRLPFPSRAACPLSCSNGFRPSGASVCARGEWQSATCVTIGMPLPGCQGTDAPAPENGKANCEHRIYGSGETCDVVCESGHRMAAKLLCAGREWLTGSCEPLPCDAAPLVANSEELSTCASSPHGSRCQVECLEGFEPTSKHVVCQRGLWTAARCQERRCSAPARPDYAVGNYSHCANLRHGELCQLSCEEGFQASAPMRCDRGYFTRAYCEARPCGFPVVQGSGDLSTCSGYPSGALCELHCEAGHQAGAVLRCERGNWSEALCWRWPGCGEPPQLPNAEAAKIQDCINLRRGQRCTAFHCNVGFQVVNDDEMRCRKRGFFSQPKCAKMPCSRPPSPGHSRGTDSCTGTPSGGVCRISCEPGYAPRAAMHCLEGSFIESSCEPLSGPLSYALDESMLLALHLRVSFTSWENLQAQRPGLRTARLARALAHALGLPSWRLVAKESRPYSLTSTVVDLLLLPASYKPASFRRLSVPRPAQDVLAAAQDVLKAPTLSELLTNALSLPNGEAIGVLKLEMVSNTVGRMCVHPPVVEYAKDLTTCAFTLSGHVCPLVCEAGFVHSGSLACQDGAWLLPHCEEMLCDSPPNVENSEDLSHCQNSATGSICILECQPGYERTGDLECSKGFWVGAKCLPKTCKHLPPLLHADHRALRQCRGIESGSECLLQCEAGYLPTGEGKLRCNLGNFQLLSQCLPADCHQTPSVRNSRIELADCAGLKHGTACNFRCKDGYQKVGELQCFFGRFTSARCKPADCQEPPSIQGLTAVGAARCVPRPSGMGCNATCDFPLRLVPQLTCSHGKWLPAECVPYSKPGGESCHRPPALHRAGDLTKCSSGKHGERCEASCVQGYALDRPLICYDSLWSKASCEPLQCGTASVERSTSLQSCVDQEMMDQFVRSTASRATLRQDCHLL